MGKLVLAVPRTQSTPTLIGALPVLILSPMKSQEQALDMSDTYKNGSWQQHRERAPNQFQACSPMGSPTVPSTRRLPRSCAFTQSSPDCISDRINVGAV